MFSGLDHHLRELADLLYEHNDILCTHPNDLDLSVLPPSWAVPWRQLLEYYVTGSANSDKLPDDLKRLVDAIRALQLPRRPMTIPEENLVALHSTKGMSPKKLHEVKRMASYIKALVEDNGDDHLHIVDVGAGQGYLTRALAHALPSAKILALDADEGQTTGAELKLGNQKRLHKEPNALSGQITHRTALITPLSLLEVVDDWIKGEQADGPVPVLFVALHSCGSLTPDILKAFVDCRSRDSSLTRWRPCGVVVVGCCYNLMYPGGLFTRPLPLSAYHLAAQIPETWLEPLAEVAVSDWNLQPSIELATRKVAWRALLAYTLNSPDAQILQQAVEEEQPKGKKSADVPVKWWLDAQPSESLQPDQIKGVGQTAAAMRLGKIPDSAYTQGWEHFLRVSGKKIGLVWNAESSLFPARDKDLERRIEVLHVLRCLVGPAVESAIVLDRLAWLKGQLRGGDNKPVFQAELINLFDQRTGSGRNIGICVATSLPSFRSGEEQQ
ncbi:hypothetical protein FA15DRAFT_636214 [Coprinopsis marcescibilis]|uniref:Methyltransferase domain-containing protein n=1 Tax=Coprinopsis marcescibilis TaxID=230819 RepID=A0A5C3LFA9_COPMA|nr:hypothetical protein FA15DRAFT_636214 [Coprinopsis marcescibilis]